MDIYLLSDTHFCHRLCANQRGFESISAMDEALTEIWNQTIKPNDTVYHLGDFAWKDPAHYLKNLNGKITLLRGNHDRNKMSTITSQITVLDYLELKVNHQKFILCHFPFYSWNGSSHNISYHCHGHSHGKLKDTHDWDKGCLDVGVDTNDLKPYHIDEAIAYFERWKLARKEASETK